MSDTAINSTALADAVHTALDDGKAVDIRTLDVARMTVITDYMVVATGRSSRQVKALVERVREAAAERGVRALGVEGENAAEWILVDLGDVVVHIMQAEAREFYQLEKLWDTHPLTQADGW